MKTFVRETREAGRKSIVILSAELATSTKEANAFRTDALQDELEDRDFAYKIADGFYFGKGEVAFIVEVEDDHRFDLILDMADFFNQESVLHIDRARNAQLIFLHQRWSKMLPLGKLTAVSKEIALQNECYTLSDGVYFITMMETTNG